MIAHHTLGGCNLRPGDLLGSGTISGGAPGTRGCLLEATSAGRDPLLLEPLVPGHQPPVRRVWLEDGDEVILSGWCRREGVAEAVSFGECRGIVLPAHPV